MKEIAIPGFLLLEYEKQVRKEGKLGAGGTGCVYSGVLIDPDLNSQHQTKKIALKHVPKSSHDSEQESKDLFLQEVSFMWFVFLLLFSFSFFFQLFFDFINQK